MNDEPKICDYLRTKTTGAAHGDKRAIFALRNEATTIYWCLLTMSPSGPDDGLVHANRCGPERSCCMVGTPCPDSGTPCAGHLAQLRQS